MNRLQTATCSCFDLAGTTDHQRQNFCRACGKPRFEPVSIPQADGDDGQTEPDASRWCQNYQWIRQQIQEGKWHVPYVYPRCIADRNSGCCIQCGVRV